MRSKNSLTPSNHDRARGLLAEKGFFAQEELDRFCEFGALLVGKQRMLQQFPSFHACDCRSDYGKF